MNVLTIGFDTAFSVPGLIFDETSDLEVASKNFNAKNYDLILFEKSLRGQAGDRLEKSFFAQNISIEFLYSTAANAVEEMKIFFGL